MATNRPQAIASFPRDRTNAFGDLRQVGLAAVARVRGSEVKKEDLLALLEHFVAYVETRYPTPEE